MSIRAIVDFFALRRHLHRPPEELRQLQLKMLRSMLRHAYDSVPFYQRKLKNARVSPEDVHSLNDLVKIPTTTRQELQSITLRERLSRNTKAEDCVQRITSGSTGVPIIVFNDRKAFAVRNALWFRAYVENGLGIKDKIATVGDPHGFPARRGLQGFLMPKAKNISVSEPPEVQLRILDEYQPDAIKAFPSVMLLLARLCKSSDHRFRPRLIFTVGETLDIEAREFINSAFDTKVRDNYSCIEFGHLAWECPSNMGYHINTDCAVMEFVNDGEQVSPGERGEIVCTGLINHAMPLLRYELGDVAIPEEESCTCGVTLPLMRSVEGRRDDFLVATDGRLISPLAFSAEPIEKGISGLRQYRIVQEKTDKVIIEIALQKENELPNQESLRQARKGMKDLLGQDMQVEFAIVQNIDKGSTGKVRRLISHLPREHRTIDLQKTMAESETTNTA